MRRINISLRVLAILFILVTVFGTSKPNPTLAQTEIAPLWSDPVNLSQSGAAGSPLAVVDRDNQVHVVWLDALVGWMVREYDGDRWSDPQNVNLPMGKENVVLISGGDLIHAFWIGAKGELAHSAVPSNRFSDAGSWSPAQTLASSAADYAVAADQSGVVHVAYIKNLRKEEGQEVAALEETGIFYQQFRAGWSNPVVLYPSEYYRALQKQNANLQIALDEENQSVFVAWDDIPNRRILMTRSLDGGKTWDKLQEVDGPAQQIGVELPFNVRLAAHPQGVLRMWQRGLPGEYCSQYYQVSQDQGETWSDPLLMFANFPACPQENQLNSEFEDFIFLHSEIQNQHYWLVFHGGKWSEPQSQPELSDFEDPQTLLDVQVSCNVIAVVKPETVLSLSCGKSTAEDIWLRTRNIGSLDTWFPPPSIWIDPLILTNPVVGEISYPVLVSDRNNRLHAFWTQHDETILSPVEDRLYYAFWDRVQWTKPIAILDLVDVTVLKPYDVEITEDGRILVVWNGKPQGTIYFSWASADRAFLTSEWADPVAITPQYQDLIYENSPDLIVDAMGTYFVAYSVSINEGRGIFEVRSADKGETWSTPVQILDGEANQWQVIGPAKLAIGMDQSQHTVVGKQGSPFVSSVNNIVYSRKSPNEATWRVSEELYDPRDEGESVTWYKLLTDRAAGVHLLWQTKSAFGPAYVWHQYSPDNGLTFNASPTLQRFSETIGTVDAVLDPVGKPHLLLVDQTVDGRILLRNQEFDDRGWQIVDNIGLTSPQAFVLETISASYTQDGFLGLMIVGEKVGEGYENEDLLLFTLRLPSEFVEVSQDQEQIPPTQAPLPTPTPTSVARLRATPTLTPVSLGGALIKVAPKASAFGDPMIVGPLVGGGIAMVVVVFAVIRSLGNARNREKD